MKAKDLMKLLQTLPADVEIVIGDPGCGMFWNPVVSEKRAFTGWKVAEDWAEQQIRHVNIFALLPPTHSRKTAAPYDKASAVEMRAVCL
ncbi:MAG: hypothetical protein C4516_00200 [Oxalobacter sp.]|nr:MAG: hypothetical protein C4516_00200 [Oxalobacter sp.]